MLEVYAAIDFYPEPEFMTIEIKDKALDHVLSAKFEIIEFALAKEFPDGFFGFCLAFSKCPGKDLLNFFHPTPESLSLWERVVNY